MISNQKQSAGDNSTVIQSAAGVTINQTGLSITQMAQILHELEALVGQYSTEAQVMVDERLKQFREEILHTFQDPEKANTEAFKDPDFQFVLNGAQRAYARQGDEATGKLLAELLAARSKRPSRDHMALILNEATEKVSKITDEDLSILTISFILFNTMLGYNHYTDVIDKLNAILSSDLINVRAETSSYAYLETIGCLTMNGLLSRELESIFLEQYGEVFTDGFTIPEITSIVSDANKRSALYSVLLPLDSIEISNPYAPSGPIKIDYLHSIREFSTSDIKWRFNIQGRPKLLEFLDSIQLNNSDKESLIKFLDQKRWKQDRIDAVLSENVNGYAHLRSVWNKTALPTLSLTAVGIAIAHANVIQQFPAFGAPLSIWIK